MNDKLTLIREKCIAANPEIKGVFCEGCGIPWKDAKSTCPRYVSDPCYPSPERERPIRLADVLLAIETAAKKRVDENEGEMAHVSVHLWNLRADDLQQQSEETINFLHELLK